MRHRKNTIKLGRTSEHRRALLASLVCNLIKYKRIHTTVAKAKAARPLAEKMVTLAKQGTLASHRRAVAKLRDKGCVSSLFSAVAPAFADRAGGYTRIVRTGRRASDSSEMAIMEWVNYVPAPPKKKKAKKGEKETPEQAAPKGKEKESKPRGKEGPQPKGKAAPPPKRSKKTQSTPPSSGG